MLIFQVIGSVFALESKEINLVMASYKRYQEFTDFTSKIGAKPKNDGTIVNAYITP